MTSQKSSHKKLNLWTDALLELSGGIITAQPPEFSFMNRGECIAYQNLHCFVLCVSASWNPETPTILWLTKDLDNNELSDVAVPAAMKFSWILN